MTSLSGDMSQLKKIQFKIFIMDRLVKNYANFNDHWANIIKDWKDKNAND